MINFCLMEDKMFKKFSSLNMIEDATKFLCAQTVITKSLKGALLK